MRILQSFTYTHFSVNFFIDAVTISRTRALSLARLVLSSLPLSLTPVLLPYYVAYLLVQSLAILSCSSRFCVY